MINVQQIAAEIVKREGGYVNDPDDPGGATKYGVTIGTMRGLGLDLDHDGDVDTRDVKLLKVEDAINIFLNHYYKKPNIHRLPEPLQATVFDMQVNAGNNAIKILQRLLADFQFRVSVDGAMGPETLRAVAKVHQKAGGYLVDAYGIARRNYYFRLADRRAASRKYAMTRRREKGGWIRRAEEFISPKYQLTNAQFKARVSKW